MSEWSQSTLADLVTLQRGHDLPAHARREGTVPVVGSAGISGTHDVALYEGPGVVIGRSGSSIGVASWVDEPYWPLNTGLFVKDFKGNDPAWIFRLLTMIDFASFDSGSAQPSLNRNYLGAIRVAVPPQREQRGIAEVLGALDDKIAANAFAHEAASRLAVALAQSDQTVRLEQVADQVKGTVNPASFGAALVDHFSLPAFDGGSGPEVVAGATIKSNKTRVAGNTVLISKLNPRFPRIWNVIQTDDSRPALASTEFIPVTSKLIPSSVLWAALSAPGFASALESKVAGTSGSHQRVKPADLLATEIADPRSLSAGAITSIVSLGQMRDAFMAQTGKLVATRDALLPLLMSGKVKVKDAESVVGDVI